MQNSPKSEEIKRTAVLYLDKIAEILCQLKPYNIAQNVMSTKHYVKLLFMQYRFLMLKNFLILYMLKSVLIDLVANFPGGKIPTRLSKNTLKIALKTLDTAIDRV